MKASPASGKISQTSLTTVHSRSSEMVAYVLQLFQFCQSLDVFRLFSGVLTETPKSRGTPFQYLYTQ